MSELDSTIAELEARLDRLVYTQVSFQNEITQIRSELASLRGTRSSTRSDVVTKPLDRSTADPVKQDAEISPEHAEPLPSPLVEDEVHTRAEWSPSFGMKDPSSNVGHQAAGNFSSSFSTYLDPARENLEKFIGENLISKIGIVVLVLGVGIGAKYAIDNGWISPLMRILFGYGIGFGLLGFAAKLKSKYHDFSAVLVSGGMAILYFVTFFAYSYYSLIPQSAAFALMAIFTAFTVAAAILYDRQVIAHIGLVGAYAVPFLLSDNSGNYLFLFSYMAIINAGVLAISVKKYWKYLFYSSFVFTWLIYGGWFATKYVFETHFYLALVFLAVFFSLFYTAKVIHGVVHSENNDAESIVSILFNGFVFYSFIFAIADVAAEPATYAVLFTYLAVSSLIILLTSYRYYGRIFIYLSYPFTWLIFGAWFSSRYNADEHFMLAAVFASVFFAVYYATTLIYRLITNEIGLIENSALVLTNSFLFYGFGYAILDSREGLRVSEGLFTVSHAGFHFLIAQMVSRLRSSVIDVVQVLTILVLTFATIAIPIQFDGNMVTLVWTAEAAMLFWFGRTRKVFLFEYFSFPLMALASGSLVLDWLIDSVERAGLASEPTRLFANGNFVAAAVFVIAFAFIYVVNREEKHDPGISRELVRPFGIVIAALAIAVLYNLFRIEISNFFHLQIALVMAGEGAASTLNVRELSILNSVWQINYSLFFLVAMSIVNLSKARSVLIAISNVAAALLFLALFMTAGMQMLTELREISVLEGPQSRVMNIAIRWVSYGFVALLVHALWRYRNDPLSANAGTEKQRERSFDFLFFATVVVVTSFELLNLANQFSIADGAKYGLSILWGVIALVMIAVGINFSKKHLRIAAMGLLAVTLGKLFLYDIADLGTVPKTILFVTLGGLLLVVSFLYNKYKYFIFKDEADLRS